MCVSRTASGGWSPSASSSVPTELSGPGSTRWPSITCAQTARSAPWKWTSISRWDTSGTLLIVNGSSPHGCIRKYDSAHGPSPAGARPTLDDADLRGALDREEVQRAVPLEPGEGPDGPV